MEPSKFGFMISETHEGEVRIVITDHGGRVFAVNASRDHALLLAFEIVAASSALGRGEIAKHFTGEREK